MVERVVLVCAVAAVVLLLVLAIRRWNARRIAAIGDQLPNWLALGVAPDDRRTVIAFSTPSCAACHAAQSPAIEHARAELAEVDIRRIDVDVARQPEVARLFGILTVPSTVIIGPHGTRIVAVNQGFTPSARLVEQLQARY